MTTTLVFVLCCNLLWVGFHGGSTDVQGLKDPYNTSMVSDSANRSKHGPISVSVTEGNEMHLSSERTVAGSSYFGKVHDRQKVVKSRAKTLSQLLKLDSGHLSGGKIRANKVSSDRRKHRPDFIRTSLVDDKPLSTVPTVMFSKNNKLYYSENNTGHNFVISIEGESSGTTRAPKTLPKLILPTRPVLTRQSSHLPGADTFRPTEFSRAVEKVKFGANKKNRNSEATSKQHKPDFKSGYSERGHGPTNSFPIRNKLDSTSPSRTAQSEAILDGSLHSDTDMTDGDGPAKTDKGFVWSEWGACSVSCGTGTQERSRTCGPNCQQVESRECYLESCHGIMRRLNFSDRNVEHEFHINDATFNQSGVPKQTFLDTEVDACAMWSSCKDEYLQRYMSHLTELASCPCYYPINLDRNKNVWDVNRRRYYQWLDVNATEEKLHVYKPRASWCIRSLLFPGAATLAAQVCCYTDNSQLITRGRNAGTPNLISPQISWELHYKIDILPWVICKGDWTRYNRVLPPNNMLGCPENPDEAQLMDEVEEARDY